MLKEEEGKNRKGEKLKKEEMENPKLSSSETETETETEPEPEPEHAQLYMVYLHYKVAQDPALREKLLRQLLTRCIKIFLSRRDEGVRKYLL